MFQKNKKMDLYGEEGSSPEATPDKDEVKVEHHRQKFEILARALQVSVAKRSTESRQVLNGESVHRRYIPGRSDGRAKSLFYQIFTLILVGTPTSSNCQKVFFKENRPYFKTNQNNHNSLI